MLTFSISYGLSQTQAEKDLLKPAEKKFESGEFLEALPNYRQLVSIAPKNKDYNFKYGTCLLSSDEDVSEAINHLRFACRGGSFQDKRAYFYLGKAYHLDYQFADALESYHEFKEKVDAKTGSSFREVDRLITMATNGKALLSDIKDIKVLDRTESTVGDFFRNYDLTEMGGSIIKVPQELLSSVDKKQGHSPIMYFPNEGGTEIIFSSYGRGDHLDLYSVRKTASGGFTIPEKLNGVVNSPFDEDFPFLHEDGRTLYFSSKGHNSMGGYDVFKSMRNLSTGVFESPTNLDFAISSPDDDIFYVVDKQKRRAHFASTRSSEEGRLHVYEVAVQASSMELAIVKGALLNSKGGSLDAQIKVLDATTNEEIGAYRTDKNGDYLIDLPGTGKYKFFIDIADSDITHTGQVDVPSFGRMRAFEQDMELTEVSGQEKLVIKNHFDEEPSEDVMQLAHDILKAKAQLDINYDGPLESLPEDEFVTLSPEEIVIQSGYAQGTTVESVLETAYDQERTVSEQVLQEQEEKERAFARTNEYSILAEEKMNEASALFEQVQTETDPARKEELMILTALKRAEAEQFHEQAEIALKLTEELEEATRANQTFKDELQTRNQEIEASLANGDSEKAIELFSEVKKADDEGSTNIDALESSTKKSLELKRESQTLLSRFEDASEERNAVSASIKTKENVLGRTTKPRDKEVLDAELMALRSEEADLDERIERLAESLDEVQEQSEVSTGSVDLLEKLRMGEDPELIALQPKMIPDRGIENSRSLLTDIDQVAESIILRDEEIEQIMAKRPQLLANLSTKEQGVLGNRFVLDFQEIADDSGFPGAVDEEGQQTSIEDNLAEESSASTETEDRAAPLESEEQIDYSALTSEDLLLELQSDYSTARSSIESSDLGPVDRAQSMIDLNRAAVQNIEQKILVTKYSEGYVDDPVKNSNVDAMEGLVEELKAEMLVMAKESEDAQLADATQGETNSSDLESTIEASGMQTEISEHYRALAAINNDTSTSPIVEVTARVKEHLAFIDLLREEQMSIQDESTGQNVDDEKEAALITLSETKRLEIKRDVDLWMNESGIELDEAEKILARNDDSYLAQRSLLEAQRDSDGIESMNLAIAERLVYHRDSMAVHETYALLNPDDYSLIESMILQGNSLVLDDSDTPQTLDRNADISFLGRSKDWTNKLFDNKRSKNEGLAAQAELAGLDDEGLDPDQRTIKEMEVAESLRSPIDEEMLWKEEVMKLSIHKDEVHPEVTAVMEEAYVLDRVATQLRSESNSEQNDTRKNQLLKQALLLELSSLDKMEESISMQRHLSRGRNITSFSYEKAIVVDDAFFQDQYLSDLIAQERTESAPIDEESTDLLADEVDDVEDEITTTEEVVDDVLDEAPSEIDRTAEEVDVVETAGVDSADIDLQEEETIVDNELDVELEEELANVPELESSEDIEAMDLLSSTDAIRTYPNISSELTAEDILPVLTVQEEMQLRDAIVEDYRFTEDERSTGLQPDELRLMEEKEVELVKSQSYQAELQNVIGNYQEESRSRKVQLAEVINSISEEGATEERLYERAELTAEVQVIESYIDQARGNQLEVSRRIEGLLADQESMLSASQARVDAIVAEEVEELIVTIEEDTPVEEEVATIEEEIAEELEEEAPEEEAVIPSNDGPITIPEVLTQDLFNVSEVKNEREIPIDIALPSGEVYQVQVGAFRNPIPVELFSEFDPIMGERLNSGIVRYKVGLFLDRNTAESAKLAIRSMGYSDAFVVRYVDGQRDGVASPPIVESASNSASDTAQNTTGSGSDNRGSQSNDIPAEPASNVLKFDPENPTAYYDSFEAAAPATQVETVDGLFYTVQVGVYSKPVTSASIFEITPLNSELLNSGLIKYTSGIFDDFTVADQWKAHIQQKGVSDAFITAYHNGSRISLNQAAILLSDRGDEILADLQEMDALHTDRQGQAVWEMVSTSDLFAEEVREQIQFKIRMGPYFERIPDKDVKVILDFEDNVDYGRREDGAIVYTTKGGMTYQEAQKWRTTFLESGITNANIIALQNGNEISVKQALDFLLK